MHLSTYGGYFDSEKSTLAQSKPIKVIPYPVRQNTSNGMSLANKKGNLTIQFLSFQFILFVDLPFLTFFNFIQQTRIQLLWIQKRIMTTMSLYVLKRPRPGGVQINEPIQPQTQGTNKCQSAKATMTSTEKKNRSYVIYLFGSTQNKFTSTSLFFANLFFFFSFTKI